jgi:hypothetical protein
MALVVEQLALATMKAGPAPIGPLRLDQAQVVGVDFGDEQGHVGRQAIRGGVGKNGKAGRRKLWFKLPCQFGGQGGKNEGRLTINGQIGCGGLND